MADFSQAQPYILKYEGGWCNVAGDSGGETYCGIARNPNPGWAGWAPIDVWKAKNGTPKYNQVFTEAQIPGLADQVGAFFKSSQWDRMLGDQINDQGVATMLYDFFVNAGGNAVKCIQRIVGTTPDGGMGPQTLSAVNDYTGDLLKALTDARISDYQNLVQSNPSLQQFLNGWLNRTNSLYSALTA